MRVEIVDIEEIDAYADSRSDLTGMTGTFATKTLRDDGFSSGRFYPDDNSDYYYFLSIKTKPIYDA